MCQSWWVIALVFGKTSSGDDGAVLFELTCALCSSFMCHPQTVMTCARAACAMGLIHFVTQYLDPLCCYADF